jgi:ankyrin repeat protein
MELAMNYLSELLENGKVRSFYFLYELDPSVINTSFDLNRNVLHQVTTKGNYTDMIKVIMKLKPDLINLPDSNKETPLLYHTKHNPTLLECFIDYEFDGTITDLDGNVFLHHLCKHDQVDILRIYLKQYQELIDMPNKKSETPIILACIANKENMFYALKAFGADVKAKDYYGNTVYHYICANAMCLGMIIENTQNYFGLTPVDYCKISTKYWNFVMD